MCSDTINQSWPSLFTSAAAIALQPFFPTFSPLGQWRTIPTPAARGNMMEIWMFSNLYWPLCSFSTFRPWPQLYAHVVQASLFRPSARSSRHHYMDVTIFVSQSISSITSAGSSRFRRQVIVAVSMASRLELLRRKHRRCSF